MRVLQVWAQGGADLELPSDSCVGHRDHIHPQLPALLPVPLPGSPPGGGHHDEHDQSL